MRTVGGMVVHLGQVIAKELATAEREGMPRKQLSEIQVILAKVMLADPMNADSLDIKIGFGKQDEQN